MYSPGFVYPVYSVHGVGGTYISGSGQGWDQIYPNLDLPFFKNFAVSEFCLGSTRARSEIYPNFAPTSEVKSKILSELCIRPKPG